MEIRWILQTQFGKTGVIFHLVCFKNSTDVFLRFKIWQLIQKNVSYLGSLMISWRETSFFCAFIVCCVDTRFFSQIRVVLLPRPVKISLKCFFFLCKVQVNFLEPNMLAFFSFIQNFKFLRGKNEVTYLFSLAFFFFSSCCILCGICMLTIFHQFLHFFDVTFFSSLQQLTNTNTLRIMYQFRCIILLIFKWLAHNTEII